MSSRSSSSEILSSSRTSETEIRRSLRAASISSPASVTRRAKRSGRITDSPRPFERVPRATACSAAGRRTASAVSSSALWRDSSSSRRSAASATSSGGSSTAALRCQLSTQETSWRLDA